MSTQHFYSCTLYMSVHRAFNHKAERGSSHRISGWHQLPIFICQVSRETCTFVNYALLYVHAYVCICASVHICVLYPQFSDIQHNTDYSHCTIHCISTTHSSCPSETSQPLINVFPSSHPWKQPSYLPIL